MLKIAQIFNDARTSNATHNRKLKELAAVRSKAPSGSVFFSAFCKILLPLFAFQRRVVLAKRIIRFVSAFATARDPSNASQSDAFLENFLRFLLPATKSDNRTSRFRDYQLDSKIILELPEDAEVMSDLWDEVIDCMKSCKGDKLPLIQKFAFMTRSRFATDCENSDILDLFLEMLSVEQNV